MWDKGAVASACSWFIKLVKGGLLVNKSFYSWDKCSHCVG